MSSAETPVVPGRIAGLRQWQVSDGDPPRLSAIVHDELWPPNGEPLEARCVGYWHVAPQPRCSCGIYAWHPRMEHAAHVFPSRYWDGTVTGIVEAWGEVEVHADGFRAQYARPRWLVLPDHADDRTRERVADVAAQYGAEVITCAGPRDLEAHCARLGLGLDAGAVSDLLPEPPAHPQPPYSPPFYQSRPRRVLMRAVDVVEDLREVVGRLLDVRAVEVVVQVLLAPLALAFWVICGVVFVAFSLFVVSLGILAVFFCVWGLLFAVGVLPGPHRHPHTFTAADHALKIVDQAAFSTDDGVVYVALVRNTSRSLTALDVSPRGRLWGDDGRPTKLDPANDDVVAPSIPPGQVAVVFDQSYGTSPDFPIRRIAVRLHADSGFRRRRSPRVAIRAVRADLHHCLVGATVLSGRRRTGIDVAIVARNRRGRMVWASSDGVAGPLRRGASRQTLYRIYPASCRRSVRSVEAYPWWSAQELAPPRRRAARG